MCCGSGVPAAKNPRSVRTTGLPAGFGPRTGLPQFMASFVLWERRPRREESPIERTGTDLFSERMVFVDPRKINLSQ